MIRSRQPLAGLAFVDTRVRLAPESLSLCETLFEQDHRLGIVAAWTREAEPRDRVHIQPSPAVPYVWQDDRVAPFVAVRAEAVEEACGCNTDEGASAQSFRWLCDTIVHAGWKAVTYPAVLGSIALNADNATPRPTVRYSAMARAVQRLHTPLLHWLLACSPEERRALVQHGLQNPARSARWLAAQAVRRPR
jgi:hypothetical protein